VIAAFVRWVASKLNASGSIYLRVPRDRFSPGCAKLPPGRNDRALLAGPCLRIERLDLRPEEWTSVDGIVVKKTPDWRPLGSTLSASTPPANWRLPWQGRLMARLRHGRNQPPPPSRAAEYLLCRTPMDADVLINLPAQDAQNGWGFTCALENSSGSMRTRTGASTIPKARKTQGGDQFPRSPPSRMESRWMGAAKRWSKAARLSVFRARQKAGACVRDTKSCALGRLYGNDTAGGWSWT